MDLLFSERAFWMFATGHRLGDMRRLIRQYGRTRASRSSPAAYTSRAGATGGREPADADRRSRTTRTAWGASTGTRRTATLVTLNAVKGAIDSSMAPFAYVQR